MTTLNQGSSADASRTRPGGSVRDLELKSLVCFEFLAREQSFTAAAGYLGVGQPWLSRRIAQVESTVGARLFDRSTHSVELTVAGLEFQTTVRRVLARSSRLQAALRAVGRRQNHELAVGISESAPGTGRHRDEFTQMIERFADYSIRVVQGESSELLRDVRRGRLDLAYVLVPADLRGMRARVVHTENVHLVVPASHRFTDLEIVDFAALAGETVVIGPRAANELIHDALVTALRAAAANVVVASEDGLPMLRTASTHGNLALVWESDASVRNRWISETMTTRPLRGQPSLLGMVALVGLSHQEHDSASHWLDGSEDPTDHAADADDAADSDLPLDRAMLIDLFGAPFDLARLRVFVEVAQCLSFTKAAEALYSSQPWLSRQIRDLEEQIEFTVLQRSRHKVELTEAGAQVLDAAVHLVEAVEGHAPQHTANAQLPTRVIRLGAPEYTVQLEARLEALEDFADQRPDVLVEVSHGDTVELLPRVRSGDLDLAVVVAPINEEGLEITTLPTMSSEIWLPDDHRCAEMEEVPASALNGERLLVANRHAHPHLYAAIEKRWSPFGVTLVEYPTATPSDAERTRALESGILVFEPAWAHSPDRVGYVRRPLVGIATSQFLLVSLARARPSRELRDLVDMMLQAFARHFPGNDSTEATT